MLLFFFFQAEDGIRDYKVTGVQTCALPICPARDQVVVEEVHERTILEWRRGPAVAAHELDARPAPARARRDRRLCLCEIGRASCRERGETTVRADERTEQNNTAEGTKGGTL